MFDKNKIEVRNTVGCPNCQAKAGAPCTVATDKTRKRVTWLHAARYIAYDDSLN